MKNKSKKFILNFSNNKTYLVHGLENKCSHGVKLELTAVFN